MTNRELCDRLIEEMYKTNCASLCAPLIGIDAKVVVIRDEKDQIVELVNPRILVKNRLGDFEPMPALVRKPGPWRPFKPLPPHFMPVEYAETCYELRHVDGKFIKVGIIRPGIVHLRAETPEGRDIAEVLHGYMSIAVQHEVDHLNGIKLIDRVGKLRRKIIEQALIASAAEAKYCKPLEARRVTNGVAGTRSGAGFRPGGVGKPPRRG